MTPRARRVATAVGVVVAVLVAAPLLLLAGVDHGLFDGAIQRTLTAKLGRKVSFGRLETHLLSSPSTLVIDNLVVGSPPAITPDNALAAPRVTARIDLAPLLIGRIRIPELTFERPVLRLVRLGHGRNNYSMGSSSTSGGLRGVGSLTITGGDLHFHDVERDITLQGPFVHDGAPGAPRPLLLTGGGVIKGAPYRVQAHGGPLNARPDGAPYPFDAAVQDGRTQVSMTGTSGKPFDFRQLDIRIQAQGPNLADLSYLFGAPAPNSAPFHLAGHLRRDQPVLTVSDLVGQVGSSDIRGSLSSDHKPGARRQISADLRSKTLYLRDLRAALASHPAHTVTRDQSGAVASRPASGPLFSDTPFKAQAMNRDDLHLQMHAARVPDAAFSVSDLSALLVLEGGRLSLAPLQFATGPGRIKAALVLDASRKVPALAATGTVQGARLDALKPGLAQTLDGQVDAAFDLKGQGASMQAAAADMSGRVALRLSQGRVQASKAAALGGDLIKAIGLSIGDKTRQTVLTCAVADLQATAGRLEPQRLVIVTDAGATTGQGVIDLGRETIALVLRGSPTHPSLLPIGPPISIQGPLRKPAVSLGTKGLAAPPKPAAQMDCPALLAQSAAFVAQRP